MDPALLSGAGLGNLNFSMGQIIAGLVFSGIGFVAFRWGKSTENWKAIGIGVALMALPVFLQDTMTLTLVSLALCVALYFFKD